MIKKIRIGVLLSIAILSFLITSKSRSEQVITCPSGDTYVCVKIVADGTVLGTTYRGEGGVKGEKKY
ncbi:hypothetical protein [Cecembia sp.]|uniref:hypothetical protein n=1 Tax=Cecembia sp. TaxID=1898110 RepID=UPI0025BF7F27|nr:hypothetical protein [Cecembia sp.]